MLVKLRNIIREIVIYLQWFVYVKLYKMNIDKSAKISFSSKLDKTNPKGVYIGSESYIAGGAIVFTHDYSRAIRVDTHIGEKCFIGANVIVMAGINIGNEVVVGSGSVVTKDIPSNCIVVGNPARIIKNIKTKKYGQLLNAK